MRTEEEKKAYQKKYYLKHREKLREWQREYWRKYKKGGKPYRGREAKFLAPRLEVQNEFIARDLQDMPAEKFGRETTAILRDEKSLV